MEYVEGESLDHVMARRGRMTWEEVVELGAQLCAALQHAHEKGIVHRDLKPSNVMVLKDGTVKLTDFGIAKDEDATALTAAHSTVGTAAYMSPEQCRGSREITYKSDLYSLGVMFFELVTGRKPFTSETAMEMFQKHASEPAPRASRHVLDIPIWLDTLIHQLMEKKPEQRPLNAATVAESLKLVREKHEQQQSAGIDAAKKRRIDRSATDVPVDETDRDAARALLGKKKKKKKDAPFYTKGWFTVTAVAVVAFLLGAIVYAVFIMPPSAKSLYDAAVKGMKAETAAERLQARKDYIVPFLEYYPDDPRADEIRKLDDQFALEYTETTLHNRRSRATDDKTEETAREALDYEDKGRVADAAKRWTELAGLKQEKDFEKRGWGLLADKSLRTIRSLDDFHAGLLKQAQLEKIGEAKKLEGENEYQKLALQAARNEVAGRIPQAQAAWDDLKKEAAKVGLDQRGWYLLATKRGRDLLDAEPAP
jgi:eukaryotic-like serine/threonine-protein kinase